MSASRIKYAPIDQTTGNLMPGVTAQILTLGLTAATSLMYNTVAAVGQPGTNSVTIGTDGNLECFVDPRGSTGTGEYVIRIPGQGDEIFQVALGYPAIATLSTATDPRKYGAVCDGATHPLSAVFGSLAAAQVIYPHATSLTNELDWAASQKAVNLSVIGEEISWTGSYLHDQILILKPFRTYSMPDSLGNVVKQRDGSNLAAVVASEGWNNNTLLADWPITVRNFQVDSNRAANSTSHGMLLTNWFSRIEGGRFLNAPGDNIRFTNLVRNGSAISGTAVGNRVIGNYFLNAGGDNFRVEDTTGNSLTDGFFEDNLLETGLTSATIDAGAGWKVEGNHAYGSQANGITVYRCFGTRITGNEVENFGAASAGGFYSGLVAFGATGWGSVVADNFATSRVGGSGTYTLLSIWAHTGSAASFTVTGNTGTGNGLGGEIGVAYQYQSGGTLAVTESGNQIRGTGGVQQYVQTGGGITFAASVGPNMRSFASQTTSGAVTLDASKGDQILVMTGNVTSVAVVNASIGQEMVLHLVQDGTGGRTFPVPAAMHFANNDTMGTHVTAANHRDVYRLFFDGANFHETSRALDVG